MNATFRLLAPAVSIALALVACASSSTESKGATSMQAPNRCLQLRAACTTDQDCCSLSCMNAVCVRREP